MALRSETVDVADGGSASLNGFASDSLLSVVVAPPAAVSGSIAVRLVRGAVTTVLRNLYVTDGIADVGLWSPALALDDADTLIFQPSGYSGATQVLVSLQRQTADTYAGLLHSVALHAPGAPDNLILLSVRRAWREFLRRSRAWRHTYTVTLAESTIVYDLADVDGARASAIVGVRLMSASEVTAGTDGSWVHPKAYRMEGAAGARAIRLLDTMPGTGTSGVYLSVECTMLLPDSALEPGNDSLFSQWAEAVVYGAAASLCTMPGRAWSNRQNASYLLGRFMQQVGEAAAETARNGRDGGSTISV